MGKPFSHKKCMWSPTWKNNEQKRSSTTCSILATRVPCFRNAEWKKSTFVLKEYLGKPFLREEYVCSSEICWPKILLNKFAESRILRNHYGTITKPIFPKQSKNQIFFWKWKMFGNISKSIGTNKETNNQINTQQPHNQPKQANKQTKKQTSKYTNNQTINQRNKQTGNASTNQFEEKRTSWMS